MDVCQQHRQMLLEVVLCLRSTGQRRRRSATLGFLLFAGKASEDNPSQRMASCLSPGMVATHHDTLSNLHACPQRPLDPHEWDKADKRQTRNLSFEGKTDISNRILP